MRVRCGAICLIALCVALSDQESNQETGTSKQLAPGVPYTHLLIDLTLTRTCFADVIPSDEELLIARDTAHCALGAP
jgi:hypothetical protein